MAQTTYSIVIDDAYVVPAGPLTDEQYVNFVMNNADRSYQSQYATATVEAGITAACAAYNANLPPEPPPVVTDNGEGDE